MSQSEYYARGAGVTLAYDSGEREDDALERLAWVVPAAFLGAGFILWSAVIEWLAPMTPILLFVGLVWTPLSLVVVWASRDGLGPGKLAGALSLLMAFGLPLMAWNVDTYRMNMLWIADRMAPGEITGGAAADPSDEVAKAACRRQLETADLGAILRLADDLEDRPELAVACLQEAGPDQRDTTARVAAELVDAWYEGWMEGDEVQKQLVCRQARHTGELAAMFGSDGRAELLNCRFNADDDVVAACCGKGASKYARIRGVLGVDPDRWLRPMHVPLFEALLEVTELPRSTLRADKPFDESLAWSPADLWHWTARLGCHLLGTEEDVEGIARNLADMTGRHCSIEIRDPMQSFAALRSVDQTCGAFVGREGRIEVDDWCSAADRARRDSAVAVAKFQVYRARRTFDVEEIVELVNNGVALVERIERRTPTVTREELASPEIDRRFESPERHRLPPEWSRGDAETERQIEEMARRRERRRAAKRAELEERSGGVDDKLDPVELDRAVGDEIREELEAFRDDYEQMDDADFEQ